MTTQNLKSFSVKQLKKQQVYLNNVISDYLFISVVNKMKLTSYYEMFPSDTQDKELLVEYITLTEMCFTSNGITDFKPLVKKSK